VDRDPQRSSPTNQRLSAQGTFLIVEDEQLMLHLMEKLLRNHGYRVLTAADGEEAIEIYRHHKQDIDAVLLDMGLPKMTGWEVLLEMKDENPAVRVVIASGYLEPEAKNRMYGAGIRHFVNKPYMPEEVVKTLQSLMQHR
jgi:two-component system, cell cycle sensor histidine kinase and response regulator CckA